MTVYSAPGKLVIAGEYAVLKGHPALVASVGRRATCSLERGDALLVSGLGLGPLPVRREGNDLVIEGDDGRLALLGALLREANGAGISLPRGHLSVDTSAFFEGGQKLGLGSSAALSVSVAALLLGEQGEDDPERTRKLAQAGHLRFSGSAGAGSGVDVAAAAYGGVLRFERGGGSTRLSSWGLCPKGLSVLVPSAGAAADTRDFLSGVRRFEERDARGFRKAVEDIAYGTLELLDAVAPDEDPRVFIAAVDRCRRALQRLGEKAGLDIVSRPHVEIARIARAHGGCAKPSGAGGGDVAVCFVPDAERARCAAALEEAGYAVVEDLELGVEGARQDD